MNPLLQRYLEQLLARRAAKPDPWETNPPGFDYPQAAYGPSPIFPAVEFGPAMPTPMGPPVAAAESMNPMMAGPAAGEGGGWDVEGLRRGLAVARGPGLGPHWQGTPPARPEEPESDLNRTRAILRALHVGQLDRGLSRAGALMGTTAGHYLLGQRPQVPEVDSASDVQEYAGTQGSLEAQDPASDVSRRHRDFFRAQGINVPENATAALLTQVAPRISRLADDEMDPTRLALRVRDQELRERALDQSREFRDRGLDLSEQRFGRLPAKPMEQAKAMDYSLRLIDKMSAKFNEVEGSVGPVFGRWQKIAKKFGVDSPEASGLMADLTEALGVELTRQTGAQRGMKEVEFLRQAIPDAANGADTFRQLMKNWRERILLDLNAAKRVYGNQGFKTDIYDEIEGGGAPPASGAPAASPGMVLFDDGGGGDLYEIPEEEARELQAGGHGRIVR